MTELEQELHFPLRRESIFSPPELTDQLRAQAPVSRVRLPGGGSAWLVSGYEEAKVALADSRISNDPSMPGAPVLTGERKQYRKEPGFFVDSDPPEHTRLRRMLVAEFNARRINAMRPGIERCASELVDAVLAAGPPAELVADLAMPLASLVICQLLGAPYADHEFFQAIRKTLVNVDAPQQTRQEAFDDLHHYLSELVAAKRKQPADDVVSMLITNHLSANKLTLDELTGMVMLLLFTGFETTANMVALGAAVLLQHPDQLAALREEPGLMPRAVEEMLRYFSTAALEMAGRSALADIEIGGQLVRAGDGIIVQPWLANHDATVLDRPDEFDIRREAPRHLAFGHGPHQCLGQNLVRSQMEIALRLLLDRIPSLRLAVPVADLKISHHSAAFGLAELPVTW